MKKIVIIAVLLGMCYILNAQNVYDGPTSNFNPNFNPNFNLGGFLSPDKVKMNHSMSFMSGMSSRGDGFYQSSYTNHLQFQLRHNLKLDVDLSVVNLGTMSHNNNLNFSGNDDNQSMVVPAFSLEFRPTQNTTFYFEYRQHRGYQSPYFNRENNWRDW